MKPYDEWMARVKYLLAEVELLRSQAAYWRRLYAEIAPNLKTWEDANAAEPRGASPSPRTEGA